MVSKNCSRLLFRPYFSKLACDAKVICRIVLPFHLQLYASWFGSWDLCRGSLVRGSDRLGPDVRMLRGRFRESGSSLQENMKDKAMIVASLAWRSLVWDPHGFQSEENGSEQGPLVPIEGCRPTVELLW